MVRAGVPGQWVRGAGVLVLLALQVSASSAADALAKRSTEINESRRSALRGKVAEYGAALAALQLCADALGRNDLSQRRAVCQQAQQTVDLCRARRANLVTQHIQFMSDALAARRAEQFSDTIKAEVPPCPSTVPGFTDEPAQAVAEQGRRERRRLPGFLACDSYLRALLDATDQKDADRAARLATELVFNCDADHPDYRLQAIAALTRLGLDADSVLGRIRRAEPPASQPRPVSTQRQPDRTFSHPPPGDFRIDSSAV